MIFKTANNAISKLADAIDADDTSLTVSFGTGALFPVLEEGYYFTLTLNHAVPSLSEIVWVTAVSGDVFTIERGKENTTPSDWPVDTIVENLLTSGQVAALAQIKEFLLIGTGDASIDTPALQAAVDRAEQLGLPTVLVTGTFAVTTPEEPNWYWQDGQPTFICVFIRSNVNIVGPARFIVDLPTTLPSPCRVGIFGTENNFDIVIKNPTFTNLVFDFGEFFGKPVLGQTFGIIAVGVDRLKRINVSHTVTSTQSAPVTISESSPVLVEQAGHPYAVQSGQLVYFTTTGMLPSPLQPYTTYEVGSIVPGVSYSLRTPDRVLIDTVGPQSGIHTAHMIFRKGRGIALANCINPTDSIITHENIIQGYFLLYVNNQSWSQLRFTRSTEAVDVQGPCVGLVASNIMILFSMGEGQGLDFAALYDATIDGVVANYGVTSIIYIYNRPWFKTYTLYYRYRARSPVTFTLGNPGVVNWPNHGMSANNRVTPSTTNTLPTPLVEEATFYVVGPSITLDTFQVSLTPDGPPVEFSGVQGGDQFMRWIPAEWALAGNITLSNVVGTNLRSDGDEAIRISNYRQDSPEDIQVGVGPVFNVTLDNINLEGGRRVVVNEGKDININNMTLTGFKPSNNDLVGAALVLRQSLQNSVAIANSFLTGVFENITINDSEGMGVHGAGLSTCLFRNIKINGFNLQADTITRRAFFLSRLGLKAAVITIDGLAAGRGGGTDYMQFALQEIGANPESYRVNLKGEFTYMPGPITPSTSPVNNILITNPVNGRTNYILPQVDTIAGSGVVYLPVLHASQNYNRVISAQLVNLLELPGNAVDFTRATLCHSKAGFITDILNSNVPLDNSLVPADTELSMGFAAMAVGTLLEPGDTLLIRFNRNGAGSIVPPMLLKVCALAYDYDVAI